MAKLLLLAVVTCAFIINGEGLKCRSGGSVSSMSFFNYDFFNETTCPEDNGPQYCIRGEGLFLIFNLIEANVTTGLCVNSSTCEADCENLAFQLIAQAAAMNIDIGLDLTTLELSISSCERICCNTDNCNTQTIETIRDKQNKLPEPTTATTTATAETLYCATGYDIPFPGRGNLQRINCPTEISHACLRQEITLESENGKGLNFAIGICSNSTTCLDSCFETASIFLSEGLELGVNFGMDLTTEKFTISSCERICCQNNTCNDAKISEILKGDGIVEQSYTSVQRENAAGGLCTQKPLVLVFTLISIAFRYILQ